MTPERWQAAKELFHAALACPPAERETLLAERCAGDDTLRAEVVSLLAEHDRASTFLGPRAREQAAGTLLSEGLDLAPGRHLLHYELLAPLGEGGMGIVYLARDTRLERQVAIKLLPPHAGQESERVRLLQREARTISALSHPNILTIHEIGELDGHPFIVTERIEGETLEARIAPSPLDPATLLDFAVQITDAVAEAHQRGIVHRDLKPANIMVTPRGQIKVLDFGLAKWLSAPAEEAATPGAAGLDSIGGRLIGTVPYMSPEQSRGERLDARSDVFSLGIVLYQMATGVLPFRGVDAADIFTQIRTTSPVPLTQLAPAMPADLTRMVARCLEKQPERRYANARELHVELRHLRDRPAAAPTPRRALAFRAVAGALAAAALILVVRWSRVPAVAPAATVRDIRFSQLTRQPGEERHASLSPAGKWLVYASCSAGRWQLRRRSRGPAGNQDDRPLSLGVSSDTQPAISPDGRQIAFRSTREGGGLFVMDAGGEHEGAPARKLTDHGYNPAWSPDGSQLAYGTEQVELSEGRRLSEVWVVTVATGARRRLVPTDAAQPSWSPHGQRIAYWAVSNGASQRDLFTIPAGGGTPVAVTDDPASDWNPVWSPDGRRLYFISDRGGSMNLWRIPIDEASGRPLGPPEPLTAPSDDVAGIALSADGRELVYSRVTVSSNLERVALDPERGVTDGAPVALTHGLGRIDNPALSPDGRWLVFRAWSETAPEDLFIMRSDGTERRQLTHDAAQDRGPRWSPDGRQIAFYSDRSGRYEIWVIAPDGTGLRQLTHTSGQHVSYPIWSPDGRLLYAHRGRGNFVMDPAVPWERQTPEPLPQEGVAQFTAWSWSADGQHLLGGLVKQKPMVSGLGLYSLATREYRLLCERGSEPAFFLRDGRRVLFHAEDSIHLLDLHSGQSRELHTVAPDRIRRFVLSGDDRTLYYSRLTVESDLWLADLTP